MEKQGHTLVMSEWEVSHVEDLNPEPEGDPGLVHLREVGLGALLIVGVLVWVGSQWWRAQSDSSNYSKAQQAVVERKWDDARSLFTALQGYKDSPDRAADAAKQINERDTRYSAAATAVQSGRWAEALTSARAVQSIEPSFKNAASMEATALPMIYTQALSGTVAMRESAEPPGLYYRDADQWVWLRGSDKYSTLLGYGPADRLLYDVPGPDWEAPPVY